MHHGTCVNHVQWCMLGSLTSGFLSSRWRGKRSRHSRRMRNLQFYVTGKAPWLNKLQWLRRDIWVCDIKAGDQFRITCSKRTCTTESFILSCPTFQYVNYHNFRRRKISMAILVPIATLTHPQTYIMLPNTITYCILVLFPRSLYSYVMIIQGGSIIGPQYA